MIVLSSNQSHIPKRSANPATLFRTATEYYEKVAEEISDPAAWRSLRLYKTVEQSNDLAFSVINKHTLAVELTGTARHLSMMDGKIYEAATQINDICQLPAGFTARFAWQILGCRQESLMLEFDTDLFVCHCPELVNDAFLAGHLLPSNYEQKPELSYLIRLLARELNSQKRRGRLFADSVIRLLAIEIAHTAWSREPLFGTSNSVVDRKIRFALDYIESHLASEISLDDLIKASSLNATQLIASFKKQVGATPYAHVINRRIQNAVHLLQTTRTAIAEVALEVGFSDQQQMTHAFRRRIGRTPGSFRGKN